MFTLYGIIWTGIVIVGICIIILILNKTVFTNAEISKNGLKISKDKRCVDRPCAEEKLLSFMAQVTDNRYRFMEIPRNVEKKQLKNAKQRLLELKNKTSNLFSEAIRISGIQPSARAADSFRITLKNIILEMKDKFIEDLELFEYTKVDEEQYLMIRREIVNKIPEAIRSNIPSDNVVKHKLFSTFMDLFNNRFAREFIPVIEDMMDYARKFEKDAAVEKELLENELYSIVKKYTSNERYENVNKC